MARIAYILLCHKDPAGIIGQAQRLTEQGDFIAIHFDGRARKSDYDQIHAALKDNKNVAFTKRRIKCGWGEWSLVEATLEAVKTAEARFPSASHFYMLSGDCMPIKSARHIRDFLDREDVDYIESFDFFASDWIKIGLKEERLIYRHWFNERNSKSLFYASMNLQKRLGLQREVPADIAMQIGSQWWCLRRRTIEWILDFTKKRRDVMAFFRTTWIPDETFFQTITRHLVPDHELRTRTLTFLLFTDYGMPAVFYNDHYDLLLSQDYLFARKISPLAKELKTKLGDLYGDHSRRFAISNEGKALFNFLTARGRIGRRFAPRFWEIDQGLRREHSLMIVTCKKWHVAKRLLGRIRVATAIPAIEYLFNEASTELPDLGGIQSTLDKRTRHRRALVQMLFSNWKTDKLIICIDPANVDLIKDFYDESGTTRLLEIDCEFTDDYLIGHAKRVGLATDQSPNETLARLLPTIRCDVRFEADRIKEVGFDNYHKLREAAPREDNARPLAAFLDIDLATAHEILALDHLFSD
ncbi:MAG: DUF5928 domain-containing protein [Cypionkella sp.]|nr:DUF5928 domain-containing protein [Cypionkella sp.]